MVKLSTVAGLGTTEIIDECITHSAAEKEEQELEEKPVLVMIHGFGGGNGYWSLSSLQLSKRFKVYCIEMPLFGRSARESIDAKTPEEWLSTMYSAIEKWVVAMELNEFILLGHSLGSHVAAAYSVQFPHRVRRLILLSPVAVGTPPITSRSETPCVSSLLTFCWNLFSIMDFIRFLGPLGKITVRWGFNLRVKYSCKRQFFKIVTL
jgi:abhydrolase domain-containing protein 5